MSSSSKAFFFHNTQTLYFHLKMTDSSPNSVSQPQLHSQQIGGIFFIFCSWSLFFFLFCTNNPFFFQAKIPEQDLKIHHVPPMGFWKHRSRWHFQIPILEATLNRSPWLTGFLKLLVGRPPGLSDAQQVFFQSVQIRVGAVTLRKIHAALAPAVTVPANKLAFRLTTNVV